MRSVITPVLALALGLALPAGGHAEVDPASPLPRAGNMQLIVMEAEGCIYCSIFRRDVLPAYETSERGRDMPVRFVDVNDVEKSGIALQAPIDILPTFVLVKDSHELGRIPGYVGPENFYHSINYLLSAAQ